ncbi:MAG: thiamine pyrophosphate-dependent enzyme, partial [Thaumarchaeota archaeon]|nr:thiamine pyrophosphate-dependent enzyme [Nitrososphaerota archaeon]
MKRLDCLKILLNKIDDKTITVTALTGVASEWDDLRGAHLNFCDLDMGLCTPVAGGIACAQPKMRVISLDSDGSLLLDIGILVTLGKLKLKNMIILVFDNEAYGRFG